jgi:hypothetical protein
MTENYAYRVWTEQGAMLAFVTDLSHTPPQYPKYLEGTEKQTAIDIVESDKAAAGNDGFYQMTVSESARVYQRQSKASGNSWEVKYDEDWNEIPNPYKDDPATPEPPPPSFNDQLTDVDVLVRTIGSKVVITITGTRVDA